VTLVRDSWILTQVAGHATRKPLLETYHVYPDGNTVDTGAGLRFDAWAAGAAAGPLGPDVFATVRSSPLDHGVP
jgi:hypothetical protein